MTSATCAVIVFSSRTSVRENRRRLRLCTIITPSKPRGSVTGSPRKEWNRSSPVSGKYLLRSWVMASGTTTGSPVSITSPARPSCLSMLTLPTAARSSPVVAHNVSRSSLASSR